MSKAPVPSKGYLLQGIIGILLLIFFAVVCADPDHRVPGFPKPSASSSSR